jgi:Cd2+/Zn2+-exporting ATPase
MDCSDCTLVIEHSLKRLPGVLDASVSYVAGTLKIEYDSDKIDQSKIRSRLKKLGYEISATGFSAVFSERRELIFSLLCGLSVAFAWLLPQLQLPQQLSYLFFVSSYLFGGFDVTRHAIHSVKEGHFDTDLLMMFAALGSAFLGEFLEGGLLLFLFGLGHALEELALDKARDAVSKLGQLRPKTAVVIRDTKQIEVPVNELKVDEIVVTKPGARISVDGAVVYGNSTVDQSPITGESVPITKSTGDSVFAGSINGTGQLLVKVSKLAKDNTLARVMQLVEESQTQKTKTQQITERFNRWFVPIVIVLDFLLIVLPLAFGVSYKVSFLRGMTFLVAVSPCALALGAPSAMLTGIAQAARNGVLIKGGVHLETLGKLQALAFDKTGTLTHGKLQITDIVVTEASTVDEILSLTAACEIRSGHPLAAAIVNEARNRSLEIPEPTEFNSISGRGLSALVRDKRILIGNLKLMKEQSIEITKDQLQTIEKFESDGKTTVVVAQDNCAIAVIAVADTLRSNAKAALTSLRKLGVKNIFLLSGDNATVASKIAKDLGIDQTRAELMPDQKLDCLKELAINQIVAMVGDGVNDAPALAAASVGIAMGGASTDVALETADVALMGDDLSKLPFVVALGRATRSVVIQNLVIAVATILSLGSAAIFGLTTIGWAVLFHEGSTLLVVLNSLRLLTHRKRLEA